MRIEGMCAEGFYNVILVGYEKTDGCNFRPGHDSTPKIRNEEGIKDVSDILLTLLDDLSAIFRLFSGKPGKISSQSC
jgi:hypothetical protein